MKLKFGRILLLSLFLFLLPFSVFANKTSPKENLLAKEKGISIEEKAPVEKEPVKETEPSNPVNIRKIEGGVLQKL